MADEVKYYDELDQHVQESAAVGGMVAQVAYYGAFVTFASGKKPRERTFLFGGAAGSRTDAEAKAKAQAAEYQCNVEETHCLVVYKDSVLSKTVTWQDDRFETYGKVWGSTIKKQVNPRRIALDMKAGQKVWARLAWVTDVNAEENADCGKDWVFQKDANGDFMTNQDGTRMLKRIWLPVEVYANKAAAEKAAAEISSKSAAATVSDPSYPDTAHGWTDVGAWVKTKPQIQADFERLKQEGSKPLPLLLKYLAGEYSCAVEHIKMVVGIE